MRVARKCGPIHGMHSTRFSSVRSRRPLRNLLQNRPELLISHIATVVAKTVLVQVGLQILRAHVVVDPADPPLHKAPKPFDSLSVNIYLNINLRAVPDALVDVAVGLQAIVGNEVIGKHGAPWQDVFLRQAVKGFLCGIGSHASYDAANARWSAALGHPDNCNLVASVRGTPLPALMPTLSAVVHLIHLNRRTLQLQTVLGQKTPNLAEHAPRCFVGDASFPLNLLCGDTAASRAHEVHGIKPQSKRGGSFLKDCSGQRIDVIAAMVARIGGAVAHAVVLALDAALLALSDATRPALLFDVFQTRIIVGKLAIKIRDGVAKFFGDALFGLHNVYSLYS